MFSATSAMLHIGAGRLVPPATTMSARLRSKALLGRSPNLTHARSLSSTGHLFYAINAHPNSPLGKRNASNETPSRIGLIGARGYTG
jgi:hypothetical protein